MDTAPALTLRIAVAQRMADELDELVDRMMSAELGTIPALDADAGFRAEVRASNRANTEAVIELLSNPTSVVGNAKVPAAALDVVRTTVRRGLDLENIYAAYRRGQSVIWNYFMSEVSGLVESGQDVVGFLADASALLFDYIDRA